MRLTPRRMSERGIVARPPAAWRRALRRHLAWLLAVKFAALALLWALFFSPAHRTLVDRQRAARQLALLQPDTPANHATTPREGEHP